MSIEKLNKIMSDLLTMLEYRAREEAMQLKHPYIRSEHLLLALLKMDKSLLPISYEQLYARIEALPSPSCGAEQKLILAQGAKRALDSLSDSAENVLSTQKIAESILQSSPMLRNILAEMKDIDHATSD